MKPAAWMVGASLGTWLAAAAVVDRRTAVEVFFGMLGPLAMAVASWLMTERVFRRDPERLTGVMTLAFGGKMVFFGAYVAVMLGVLALRRIPFVVSFMSYFIGLHAIEALYLRRLFR
jgi:hypothetical protein